MDVNQYPQDEVARPDEFLGDHTEDDKYVSVKFVPEKEIKPPKRRLERLFFGSKSE